MKKYNPPIDEINAEIKSGRISQRGMKLIQRYLAAQKAKLLGQPVLPEWPPYKQRPTFHSEAEEVKFLNSYDFSRYWKINAMRRLSEKELRRLAGIKRSSLKNISIELRQDRKGWWIVKTSVRGCHTQGPSIRKALLRAVEALALFGVE